MPSIVLQEERIQNQGNDTRTVKAQGIGDLISLVQFQLYQDDQQDWLLATGVKWPIGSKSHRNPTTNIPLHPDLQPGTGALDFLAITYYGRNHFLWPGNRFNLTLSYKHSTSADRFNGQQEYQFGDELFAESGISFPFIIHKVLTYPAINFRYRFQTPAKTNGLSTPFTGGHWLNIAPGFRVMLGTDLSAFFVAEIPLYRQVNSIQLTTSYRLGVGIESNF